jgi:hypothetical protein
MPAQIDRFSGVPRAGCSPVVASVTVEFPLSASQRGLRSAHIAIPYNRRGTSRTGEQDGAKEANGG